MVIRKFIKHKRIRNVPSSLVIFYRISDAGYPKIKPTYINNENCLRNATKHFPVEKYKWVVIADNCSENTLTMIEKYIPKESIVTCSVGHGAGTFRMAYQMALELPNDTAVYFLENDYLHKKDSADVLLDGLKYSNYITLYDHPDKYDDSHFMVYKGGEKTRVLLGNKCHYKETSSTTMTFAAIVKTLKEDKNTFFRWTDTKFPYDCQIFTELSFKGKLLISPIPGYSTHGETAFLAPHTDWSSVLEEIYD
jgi:hypothetical protein